MMPGARFKLCSGTSLAGPMSKLRKSLELCMPGRQMLGFMAFGLWLQRRPEILRCSHSNISTSSR